MFLPDCRLLNGNYGGVEIRIRVECFNFMYVESREALHLVLDCVMLKLGNFGK